VVDVMHIRCSGPGLAFTVFPATVLKMPLSAFWSINFFFMVILIGLDTQVCVDSKYMYT